MTWNNESLIRNLNEQLRILASNCIEFDKGEQFYSLEICHRLRVILHQTNASHSLLHLLNAESNTFISTIQNKMTFVLVIENEIKSNQFFLVEDRVGWNGNFLSYFPHLDKFDNYKPISFQNWWEKEVIAKFNEIELTRKQLVLLFSNKLGGSHIEPILKPEHFEIYNLDNQVMGWKVYNEQNEELPHEQSPFLASARQIAHEVFISFDKIFGDKILINQYYYTRIELYKFVGHNREKWSGGTSETQLTEAGDYYGATFGQINNTAAIGISAFYPFPDFDIKKFDYSILANPNGKVSLIERSIVRNDILEYKADDRFGFIILDKNNLMKVIYLHNGNVIYESQTILPLPLYLSIALGFNSKIKYPRFAKRLFDFSNMP